MRLIRNVRLTAGGCVRDGVPSKEMGREGGGGMRRVASFKDEAQGTFTRKMKEPTKRADCYGKRHGYPEK